MGLVGIAFHHIFTQADLHGTGASILWTYFLLNLIRENAKMKLAIGNKETRKFKVTAEEPGDFLEVKKHVFDVEWKILPKRKVDEIRSVINDPEIFDEEIKKALVSIGGVKNEDGTDAPSTPELIEVLFDISWVRNPLVQSFFHVQNGETQAAVYKALKVKN